MSTGRLPRPNNSKRSAIEGPEPGTHPLEWRHLGKLPVVQLQVKLYSAEIQGILHRKAEEQDGTTAKLLVQRMLSWKGNCAFMHYPVQEVRATALTFPLDHPLNTNYKEFRSFLCIRILPFVDLTLVPQVPS